MSAVPLMHIIPSDKWLTTEYVRTNSVALLLWCRWHSRAVGCFSMLTFVSTTRPRPLQSTAWDDLH